MTQHAAIPSPADAADAHVHGAHGAHAHQFDDAAQQHEAVTLGMWAFLVTEIMFFGALFAGYTIYRLLYGHDFIQAGEHLSIPLGAFNTAVLLCSSLTMALAVRAAQLGRRQAVAIFLLATMLLGACFLGVKVIEYGDKIQHHLVPGAAFVYADGNPRAAELFFVFYFVMTGLHAAHMVAGIGVMVWMIVHALRQPINEVYANPIEMTGLYWHFVDIVWIFLFPVLYLSH